MELKNFLKVLSLLLVTLLLTNCSTFKLPTKTVVKTEYIEKNIPLQSHPKPLNMQNVEWYVVTEQNFNEFITKYKKEHGEEWVFYAISVRSCFCNFSINSSLYLVASAKSDCNSLDNSFIFALSSCSLLIVL